MLSTVEIGESKLESELGDAFQMGSDCRRRMQMTMVHIEPMVWSERLKGALQG